MSSRLCLYFGVELPNAEWAAALDDTDVVLEPYHPLVKDGGFATAFPLARRYVYVNPTSVDPWLLERADPVPPLIGYDDRWSLPRLDLEHPDGLTWAVNRALEALQADGGNVHGLFVDDLDRLLPDLPELAMDFLVQVSIRHGKEPGWFINRAFELWPLIEGLDVVLLEDITPQLIGYESKMHVEWTREVVFANVRQARARGVRIHALGYKDQETIMQGIPDAAPEIELAELVDSVTVGADRDLNEWRVSQ
jgi:hypothetical protein